AVARYFLPDTQSVTPMLGTEQEYFLIDEGFFALRPDLVLTGRTVMGAPSARGHQLDDHYFGSIPERAFAFMNELEQESYKLGIPLKTRHNEVAPSQYECAPQFEPLNVAIDHQLMLMDLIDRTARKHHLRALLHEKPFAGINGSGKHNNWSLYTDQGVNLLAPGKEALDNLMFLTFFVAVIKAVHDHADLLYASIASAGNDLRLGAHEAPPPIISVFVGDYLRKVLDDVENPPRRKKNVELPELKHLGISEIPQLLLDNIDRNRTSPFAFTGNKFEFRAVGSSANSSLPMTILNTIVADTLMYFKKRVDSKMNRGRSLEPAILDMLREFIGSSRSILFDGDGYSKEWKSEALFRGLHVYEHTPAALGALVAPNALELYDRTGLYKSNEILARQEVLLNAYLGQIRFEADILEELAMSHVIPLAVQYQQQLMNVIVGGLNLARNNKRYTKLSKSLQTQIDIVLDTVEKLTAERAKIEKKEEVLYPLAIAHAERIVPFFDQLRTALDQLESMLPDQEWTLPKYREMLFVR
ncbi:MAG: glutamine synthetase type III, partial [Bacteroidota bacterium]